MKHAYLIIAHNEFDVLKLLISLLDDERNDIYVHFDKKVRTLPYLKAKQSRLFVLKDRVDVRWGDSSQAKVELLLFEHAFINDNYSFFHLISGTHLPLRDINEVNDEVESHIGSSILKLWPYDDGDVSFKLKRYHCFVRGCYSTSYLCKKVANFGWRLMLNVQTVFGMTRHKNIEFQKSDQWCVLSREAVAFLIKEQSRIMRKYRHTFCSDEYVIGTELKAAGLPLDNCPNLLYVEFCGPSPRSFKLSDYEKLQKKDYLFARKFTI